MLARRGMVVVALPMLFVTSLALAQQQPDSLSPEAREAVTLLDSKDTFTRQLGFMRLEAERDPATLDIIRQHLDSADPELRAFSIRALAAIDGQHAVPMLLDRLKHDRHPRVRLAALLALEPFMDPHTNPQIAPALIAHLRDRNPEVRMAAVDTVSRLDLSEAREAIRLRNRRESNHDVRHVLRRAMQRISEPRSRPERLTGQ